jgi:hypothetical protein
MEFPKQNIPEKEKTKEWHLKCLNALYSNNREHRKYTDEKKKDHDNYLLYGGHFDPKAFAYVTDAYGLTSPARLVNYPMIKPKIDLLVGELISQPLQFTAHVINRSAIRRKTEKKITIAAEVALRPIRREMEKALGMKFPDEELGEEIPEDIEKFKEFKFRDAIEDQVHTGLQYLIQKQDLKSIFKRGMYDLAITAKKFYKVSIKNGDPFVERKDPRAMIYDIDSDKENIKDSRYAGDENWYTVNEILDFWGEQLTNDEVVKLEKLSENSKSLNGDDLGNFNNYHLDNDDKHLKVRVVCMQWKSIKMLKYKVSENKYDPEVPYYKMVKDNYKPKKGEKVVKKPITFIHQATKIGDDIIVDWGPKPNQIRFEENYANAQLDYFGIVKDNINNTTISVVDSLKNIQMLYNITIYQIELAMSRAGGKSLIYDTAQKPKNIPLDDVMYHAKNSGLILINSKQEGGQAHTFNQFQNVDFTLSQSVGQLINLKMMLEDTADKLTGISAARSGVQKSGDLVGVTQQNIMQSSLITAPLFDIHYKIVGEVFNGLANLMRIAWANEGRMANIYGDMGMETFKIDKAISLDEYGIFLANSGKEVQDKQQMMMLMERYSSTGELDPMTAVKAVRAESAVEVEAIISKGISELRAQQIEMEERQVAAQEQANEINAQKVQIPIEVAKINTEGDIAVAQINAQARGEQESMKQEHAKDMHTAQRRASLDEKLMDATNKEEEQVIEKE